MSEIPYPITLKTKDIVVAKYTVNPDIFIKWSLKFKREYKKNPTDLIVNANYKPAVFGSFIDACQEKKFSMSEETAHDLLKIAREWDAPDLVENCKEYIHKYCVHTPYYIIHRCKGYHEDIFPVDPSLFMKMSSKFLNDYKGNPDQMIVEDEYSPSVFLSFVGACQQRTASTSNDEVEDLLKLAREWGAPSVEKFCNKFIDKYNLHKAPETDWFGRLFEKIKNHEKAQEEIINIAKNINYYLTCEDLVNIPTNIFYRILTLAEKSGVNPRTLIECVMKKLEKAPMAAVPLILRINFDELTEDEYLQIYGSPEIHAESINFYTAMSLSSVYENTCWHLEAFKRRYTNDVGKILELVDKDAETIFAKAGYARHGDFEKVDMALNQQQKTIDDLTEVLEKQKDALIEAAIRAKDAPSNEQLQRRAIFSIEKSIKKAGKAINEIIDDGDSRANDILNEILEKYQQKLDKAMEALGDADPSRNPRVAECSQRMRAIREAAKNAMVELDDVRAFMAAKILSDKLRADKFLRRTEKRFDLFDSAPGLWGISGDRARQKEELLHSLEDKLEEFRPIEGATNAF